MADIKSFKGLTGTPGVLPLFHQLLTRKLNLSKKYNYLPYALYLFCGVTNLII
jgi:hypothetical protein